MQYELETLIDEEVDQYLESVKTTINSASAFTEDYEHLLNERLYYVSKNIRFELKGENAQDISVTALKDIQSKYGLAGISIFIPSDDHFEIIAATNNSEIGETTETWGYWNTAFSQLFYTGNVTVHRGTSISNEFWAGPRSLSYYQEGYYRFAYLLSDDARYLINVYISDEAMDKYIYSSHIDSALTQLNEGVRHIDSVALIDSELWQNYIDHTDRGNNDPYVKYGTFNTTLLNTLSLQPDTLVANEKQVFKLKNRDRSLILYRIDANNIIAILLNQTLLQTTSRNFIFLFTLLALAIISIVAIAVPLIIAKYSKLIQLDTERTAIIERFNKKLKEIPDFLYCCIKENERYVIIYNEGQSVAATQLILNASQKQPMHEIYPHAYVQLVSPSLEAAFNGKRNTSEIQFEGKFYEHTIIPLIAEDTGHYHIDEVLVTAIDITDRVKRENETLKQTLTDDLTGLPNRRAVKERFEKDKHTLSPNGTGYLLYLDLNHFKPINDSYGHHVGDQVLEVIAKRFMTLETQNFIIGRVGGDEFVAWITNTSYEALLVIKEHLKNLIAMPIPLEITHTLSVSIGHSRYPEEGIKFETLVTLADQSMYDDKKSYYK